MLCIVFIFLVVVTISSQEPVLVAQPPEYKLSQTVINSRPILYLEIGAYRIKIKSSNVINEIGRIHATLPPETNLPDRLPDQTLLNFLSPYNHTKGLVTRIQVHQWLEKSPSLLLNLTYVGVFFNPSIVPWKDRLFAVSRKVVDSRHMRHFSGKTRTGGRFQLIPRLYAL
jgi:hypothetical protein